MRKKTGKQEIKTKNKQNLGKWVCATTYSARTRSTVYYALYIFQKYDHLILYGKYLCKKNNDIQIIYEE